MCREGILTLVAYISTHSYRRCVIFLWFVIIIVIIAKLVHEGKKVKWKEVLTFCFVLFFRLPFYTSHHTLIPNR